MKFNTQKLFSIFALSALLVGSAACSSTPKQEEPQAQEASVEAPVETPVATETPAPVDTSSVSSTTSDASLGAASSGRGH